MTTEGRIPKSKNEIASLTFLRGPTAKDKNKTKEKN